MILWFVGILTASYQLDSDRFIFHMAFEWFAMLRTDDKLLEGEYVKLLTLEDEAPMAATTPATGQSPTGTGLLPMGPSPKGNSYSQVSPTYMLCFLKRILTTTSMNILYGEKQASHALSK
jgi:hypothetical protein